MKRLSIFEVDYSNHQHSEAVLFVTEEYAKDPMGLGAPLPEKTRANLIREMDRFPGAFSLLALFEDEPAGVANCMYSFSTFNAARVINIHDLAVVPQYRGIGIGKALLGAVEKKAAEENCCKITLEVREDNRARNLYERMGFEYGRPTMFFMSKYL